MKPENVMLLGFVNKAADYLDKHFDEPGMELTEFHNIDFNLLKKELSKGLDESLGNMSQTVQTLLQAGSDAFDEFINSQVDSGSLSEELERLFDINFDSNDSEDDVSKLLDFYDLKDEIAQDNRAVEPEAQQKKETVFEMSDEDKELLKLISSNVSRNQNHEELVGDNTRYSNDSNFENIYSQLIENNGGMDSIIFSNPGLNSVNENTVSDYEKTIEPVSVDPATLHSNFSNKPVEQPDENDIVKLVKDMQESDNQYYKHILDKDIEQPVVEEVKHSRSEEIYSFGNTLIDDLKKKMYEEDERQRKYNADFAKVYNRVHSVYTHLSEDFIRNIYANKDAINKEFPFGISIIILHRVHFKDIENLRQFVEITLDHDYSINADENKMIVDVFKEYVNTDGKILSSILTISNQSSLLEGEYEGYRVLYEREV